jgi:hypothetical protein
MMEIKSEPADLEGYISSPPTAVPLSEAERQQKLEVKDQEAVAVYSCVIENEAP